MEETNFVEIFPYWNFSYVIIFDPSYTYFDLPTPPLGKGPHLHNPVYYFDEIRSGLLLSPRDPPHKSSTGISNLLPNLYEGERGVEHLKPVN